MKEIQDDTKKEAEVEKIINKNQKLSNSTDVSNLKSNISGKDQLGKNTTSNSKSKTRKSLGPQIDEESVTISRNTTNETHSDNETNITNHDNKSKNTTKTTKSDSGFVKQNARDQIIKDSKISFKRILNEDVRFKGIDSEEQGNDALSKTESVSLKINELLNTKQEKISSKQASFNNNLIVISKKLDSIKDLLKKYTEKQK